MNLRASTLSVPPPTPPDSAVAGTAGAAGGSLSLAIRAPGLLYSVALNVLLILAGAVCDISDGC